MADCTDVTGVVVSYCTTTLLKQALESIRKFYPDMPIIVIDGSPAGHQCHFYAMNLNRRKNFKGVPVEKNIGHGQGLRLGATMVNTPYLLFFDSDIIMRRACIGEMKSKLLDHTYGVGSIVHVNERGENCDRREPHAIPYLHPYFALIKTEMYNQFAKPINHGAPMIDIMKELKEKSLSLLCLTHFPLQSYVTHLERGTRSIIRNRQYFGQAGASVSAE